MNEEAFKKVQAAVEAALAAKGGGGDAAESVDVTMPGRWPRPGVRHPLSRIIAETAEIFGKLGFTVADGPDIETRFNNFTALNTPPHHPTNDRSGSTRPRSAERATRRVPTTSCSARRPLLCRSAA